MIKNNKVCGQDNSLYIVMPAYNEEKCIESVVREWHRCLKLANKESRIVIADSGSTDKTHFILESLSREYGDIVILSDTLKEHGPKLLALYKYAIENGAEFCFQTDSDGQTNPEEFRAFWDNREQYDAIIGRRRKREDGVLRIVAEYVVCLLCRLYFGVCLADANAPFRLVRTKILKKYVYDIPFDYFIPNVILTVLYVKSKNLKTVFKDISFTSRESGKNSINVIKLCKVGIMTLIDFASFRDFIKNAD